MPQMFRIVGTLSLIFTGTVASVSAPAGASDALLVLQAEDVSVADKGGTRPLSVGAFVEVGQAVRAGGRGSVLLQTRSGTTVGLQSFGSVLVRAVRTGHVGLECAQCSFEATVSGGDALQFTVGHLIVKSPEGILYFSQGGFGPPGQTLFVLLGSASLFVDYGRLFGKLRFAGRSAALARQLTKEKPRPFVVAAGQRGETKQAFAFSADFFRRAAERGSFERRESSRVHGNLSVLDRHRAAAFQLKPLARMVSELPSVSSDVFDAARRAPSAEALTAALGTSKKRLLERLLKRAAEANLKSLPDLRAHYGILDRFTLTDGRKVTGAVVHQDETGLWVHTTEGVVRLGRGEITAAETAD